MSSALAPIAASGLLIGLGAYVVLTGFFVYGWMRRITGRAALAASILTASWFAAFIWLDSTTSLVDVAEVSAYAAWIFLLTRILGIESAQLRDPSYRGPVLVAAFAVVVYASTIAAALAPQMFDFAWPVLSKLAFCLLGIVMLEQVARNTRRDHQWNVKYLIIGLAIVFTYGFVLYADTLLFRSMNLTLLAPQGWIYAIAAPFICIASLRNRSHRMHVNLSRRFVFRTGTLLLAGGYLLLMGTAGYYVRYFGGEWGDVFEVFLVSASLIAFAVVAVSGRARDLLRDAIARNLFEYKYDYRDEWLRVTRELTHVDPDESLAERAIHALTDLLRANSGAYWRLSSEGTFLPMASVNGPAIQPISPSGSKSLIDFFARLDWIVDLDEYRRSPQDYAGLDLGTDVELLRSARFMVPLQIDERLFGLIAIGQPGSPMELNWEDYDILKVIARQTAAFLALQHADSVLSASKQLRAMNQMSAFVVHDLKTISAQLGLLVRNAERHRDNPVFIDDMLKTVVHAVERMTKLVDQLRSTDRPQSAIVLDVTEIVRQVGRDRAVQKPVPVVETTELPLLVRADRERLAAVITHVVQNAQEATTADGVVRMRVGASAAWAIITISDTGHGMSAEFIENDLFSPFATTKGVAGIGIGTYQCREYIREIGGDVGVRSQPGVGSEFTLRVPLIRSAITETAA